MSVTVANTAANLSGDTLLTAENAETLTGQKTFSNTILFSPDNTYDIGATGANRPRDVFIADDLVVGDAVTIGGALGVTGLATVATATITGAATVTGSVTFDADALHIFDTNASHDLIITPGSDLSADRVLTLTTGDSARTVTLSGNPTLADWFDQSVKIAATPTFGATTVTGALTISGASAGQIVFPGTQNASAGANTLDDYEEGTWTPTYTCGTSGTIALTAVGATYTKIGRVLFWQFYCSVMNVTSPVGYIVIGGLPYAQVNDHGTATYTALSLNAAFDPWVYYPGNSTVIVYHNLGTDVSATSADKHQDTTQARGSGFYFTA